MVRTRGKRLPEKGFPSHAYLPQVGSCTPCAILQDTATIARQSRLKRRRLTREMFLWGIDLFIMAITRKPMSLGRFVALKPSAFGKTGDASSQRLFQPYFSR